MNPQTVAVIRPATTASHIGPALIITREITTPDNAIIIPMDRSMPPEISSSAMAIVRIPSTATCCKINTMLAIVKKFGLITVVTAAIRMSASRSMAFWLLRSDSQFRVPLGNLIILALLVARWK
jgi:hypothetical protein